jgi:putative heme-binding domain-containing protein
MAALEKEVWLSKSARWPLVWAIVAILGRDVRLVAQERVGQRSQVDVEIGFNLYKANCFSCHGGEGDSVPGVNLRSGRFRRAATDDDLNRLIQTGIPGTAMPPGRYTTAELAGLVAYVRSMREFDAAAGADAGRGRAVFEGKGGCSGCHRVNGNGSRVAPDLSDVGAIRPADMLARKLLDPSPSMIPLNRSVRIVARDGTVITGRRLNEDTYTVQLIDSKERLLSLAKADLREYTVLTASPMPSYKDTLTSGERDDLVAYLRTLKGPR